jgi:D-alanine-D-alanine ligase
MKKLKIVVLHNQLSQSAQSDEADVMDQVKLVSDCLAELGHHCQILPLSLNLEQGKQALLSIKPDLIFNLVESFDNKGELVYLAPALLDSMNVPYTGTQTLAMFQTANKTLTKQKLRDAGIPTPADFELNELQQCEQGKTYLLKPRWEEGSLGLDEDSLFTTGNEVFMQRISKLPGRSYFIEEFVDGREFNCSLVATASGPIVLALAEMVFVDYPPSKPKVLGYKAKWDTTSFEYEHTRRKLDFSPEDKQLIEKLNAISLECWHACGLNGYARVDFRCNAAGDPFVLEVNANPCISPDSGFYAAVEKAGFRFTDIVQFIVDDACSLNSIQ